jgi:AcrR family transcriptional regulator
MSSERTGDARRGVGRPRAYEIDARIVQCAVEEIADVGLFGFSLVSVARRAGVAKNTVYLRWPRREDLIKVALVRGEEGAAKPPIATGDLKADLAAMIDFFAGLFGTETGLATYYQASTTSRLDHDMWVWYKANVVDPAHAIPQDLIRGHQLAGTARADLDAAAVARMLAGGVYTEAILEMPHGAVSQEFRDNLLASLMALLAVEP